MASKRVRVRKISRTAYDYDGNKFKITNSYSHTNRYRRPSAILEISRTPVWASSPMTTYHDFPKKELLKLYHGILKMLMSMDDSPYDEED